MTTVTIELMGSQDTRTLSGTSIMVGRSRKSDIRIDHPSISGRHARLEIGPDGVLTVIDEGSRNGLQVGENKVDRVAVMDGLAVRIGQAVLTFKTDGGQARAECLQRLQLPDPGVPGISPPPAPGSGLGTTPVARPIDAGATSPTLLELAPCDFSKKRATFPARLRPGTRDDDPRTTLQRIASGASTAGAIVTAVGIHGFIALLLSVMVYQSYAREKFPMTRLTLAAPRDARLDFPTELETRKFAGDKPGSDVAPPLPPRPEFASTKNLADDGGPVLDGGKLEDAPAPLLAARRTNVSPSLEISRKGAMKRLVKVDAVEKKGPIAVEDGLGGGAGNSPVPNAKGGGSPAPLKNMDDAADRVRGNLDKQGGWKTVAGMEAGEIAVVSGEYDHVQRVLDKLGVRYTLIEPRKVGGAKLGKVKVMLLNCPCELDAAGIMQLRAYVNKGGWVVSTDWSLSVVKEAFPGYLRNHNLSPETWVPIDAAESAVDNPLLANVFGGAETKPKWYLEERSYLFKVDDKAKDKVTVLIESAEMKKKWGTGVVAATFNHGAGKVLHIVSHLQQVSSDPNAHYAMYQFLANWLQAAALAGDAAEEAAAEKKK